jgi:hypothetical protein
MSFKKILKDFIIKKDTYITQITGMDSLNQEDMKEISSWSEDISEEILKNMSTECNAKINPWCVKRMLEKYPCTECSYGIRHGICKDSNSTHSKIVLALSDSSISKIEDVKILFSKTKKNIVLKKMKDILSFKVF